MKTMEALAVCLMLAASLARAQGESGRPQPGEDRFFTIVLSAGERADYESLSDAGKKVYQRVHWGRLDPSPATEENEREMEHQRRVIQALEMFLDRSGRFVWDDRARGWIRFGRPVQLDSVGGSVSGDRLVSPRQLWFYDDMVLSFEDRDLSGSYLFGSSGEATVTEAMKRRLARKEGFAWERVGSEDPGAALERAFAAAGLSADRALERLRAGEERWADVPERNDFPAAADELPFRDDVLFFGGSGGLTGLLLVWRVPLADLGSALDVDGGKRSVRIEVRAALRDSTYAFVSRREQELSADPATDPGAALLAADSMSVEPGSYRLVSQVEDIVSGKTGTKSSEIEAPSFAGDVLGLSSLLIAEDVTTDFREKGLVRRGDYRIRPRPDRTFRRGEKVYAYFEIVGQTPDQDGRYYAEVAYSLGGGGDFSAPFRGTEKGRLRPGAVQKGRSVSRGSVSSHAIAIETEDLSPGTYSLEVQATDLSSGSTARGRTDFFVRE